MVYEHIGDTYRVTRQQSSGSELLAKILALDPQKPIARLENRPGKSENDFQSGQFSDADFARPLCHLEAHFGFILRPSLVHRLANNGALENTVRRESFPRMIDRERSKKILAGVFLSSRTYGVLILLLFAGAALFRFRFPLQPLIDGDIGGYLEPALLQLTHGQFQHVEGRGFVYPGFIFLVLRVFQDFRAITVVQHLLGLAAGAVLLACWNLARTLMRKPTIPTEFYRLGRGLYSRLISLQYQRDPLRTTRSPGSHLPFLCRSEYAL